VSSQRLGGSPEAVAISTVDVRDLRPPLRQVVVDVRIQAAPGAARWFVLPDRLPSRSRSEPAEAANAAMAAEAAEAAEAPRLGPVNGAAAYLLPGPRRLVLLHAEGQGGFYALRLPGGADVMVRELALDADAESEGQTEASAEAEPEVDAFLDVITAWSARELRIGGARVADQLSIEVTSEPSASGSADDRELTAEWWPEDLLELAVDLEDARSVPTAIA